MTQAIAAATAAPTHTGRWYRRFTATERVLHVLLMLTFIGLALSGLPLHGGFTVTGGG